MKTHKPLYFVASVVMFAVPILLQGMAVSALIVRGGRDIPFTEHTIAYSFDGASCVYATDADGDGDVDVLGAAYVADDITWWENDGNENFAEHTIADNFDGAHSVYATDVDGDGDVDVLGAAIWADDITWWENDGNENFAEHTIAGNFDGASSLYAVDVDGDGDVDVLGTALMADDITWWENDGNENFAEHTVADSFGGALSVHATDVDSDGDIDVLGTALMADDITWWENDGNESFAEHTIADNFDGASSVYAVDVDGDGDMDVLGAANGANDITWWKNDGNENFAEHTIADSFDGASSVYAVDVDGDNDVDVLGAAYDADDITWWENDGNENFAEHTIAGDFNSAHTVYATDVDGDGDVDVLGAAYDADDITWWEQVSPSWAVFLPVALKNAEPPPSPPVLDDISNPDGARNYTIGWSGVSGATGYVLEEDDNALFSSPIVVHSGPDTTTTITGRDVGTYYYRVKATNSAGSGPWSNVVSTTVTETAEPPSSPVLDEISNPDGNQTYTISWSAVEGATNYILEEDDNSGFSSPTTKYSGSNTSTSISVGEVGTYYYRVQATNAFGSSPWSNVVSVEVTIIGGIEPQPGTWQCSTGAGITVRFTVSADSSSVSDGYVSISCGSNSIPGPVPIENDAFSLLNSDGHISLTFDSETHGEGGYSIFLSDTCWAAGTMTCSP